MQPMVKAEEGEQKAKSIARRGRALEGDHGFMDCLNLTKLDIIGGGTLVRYFYLRTIP